MVCEPIRCSPDLQNEYLVCFLMSSFSLLPIIIFWRQDQHCSVGAVVGLEAEPIEAGSVGRVDHEVDDEERVEGERGEDYEPAKASHVSADNIGKRVQQLSGQSDNSHVLQVYP